MCPQLPARLALGEGIAARADAGAFGMCSVTCVHSPLAGGLNLVGGGDITSTPGGLNIAGVGAADALLLVGVLDGMCEGLGGMGDAPVDLECGGLGVTFETAVELARRSGVRAVNDAPLVLV